MASQPKIVCNGIWKVFGPNPQRTLANIDRSWSRHQVQRETGHVVAVKGVDFKVEAGETFVVMGLSGSGKSTLVRCISRLIDPTEGQVLIDGDDITRLSQLDGCLCMRYDIGCKTCLLQSLQIGFARASTKVDPQAHRRTGIIRIDNSPGLIGPILSQARQ